MRILRLTETDSTNMYLLRHAAELEDMTVAVANHQTAGRGMGANTWESEAGKNLLFSVLLHPVGLPPQRQFLVSMTMAVALRNAIEAALRADAPDGTRSEEVTIKWPNDIYIGDRKVSGTRIDLNIGTRKDLITQQGRAIIKDMVIGTGVNVNQRDFRSDAPNPVSLWQVTHQEHSTEALLDDILRRFSRAYTSLLYKESVLYKESATSPAAPSQVEIQETYHRHLLYRREGFHLYEDAHGRFTAEIIRVHPDGILTLRRPDGTERDYEFKQVKFVSKLAKLQ